MQPLTEKDYKKILICLTLYVTSLVAANTLGLKITPFLFGTHLTVAIFSFPIVFLMTDVIGEVYGKSMSRIFVIAGFISTLLFIVYNLLSNIMPWDLAGNWIQASYDQVFSLSVRISIASLLAFGIAEYQDVVSFFFVRKLFGTKHFWLRSTLSNIWSQLLDSIIFMFVAFLGVYPFPVLIGIIIPLWIFKVLMGLCYMPLSYLGIYFLRGKPDPAGRNNNASYANQN